MDLEYIVGVGPWAGTVQGTVWEAVESAADVLTVSPETSRSSALAQTVAHAVHDALQKGDIPPSSRTGAHQRIQWALQHMGGSPFTTADALTHDHTQRLTTLDFFPWLDIEVVHADVMQHSVADVTPECDHVLQDRLRAMVLCDAYSMLCTGKARLPVAEYIQLAEYIVRPMPDQPLLGIDETSLLMCVDPLKHGVLAAMGLATESLPDNVVLSCQQKWTLLMKTVQQ